MSYSFSTSRGTTTGCVQDAALFQDPLLEEPPTASAPVEVRRRHAVLEREADLLCHACPLLEKCLYAAVVHHDVAGYAAGTTRKQRAELRAQLGVRVEPEDFDTLSGVTRHHRQVDHGEVVRLRHANPHESLEQLAQRLGQLDGRPAAEHVPVIRPVYGYGSNSVSVFDLKVFPVH